MAHPVDPAPPGQSFPKASRLLRRSEFVAIQSDGRKTHTPHFVLIVRDRGDGAAPRIGITTSRKVGNAVRRNRIRRLLRETFRLHRVAFPVGHDCVVVVKENAPELELRAVRDEILGALARRPSRGRPPPGADRPADPRLQPAPRGVPPRKGPHRA